jgi:hypothetical protein
LLLVFLAGAAWTPASAEGVGLRGWGPRVGVSDEPDQVVAGVHFDLGHLAKHVRWQPSADVGLGDDTLTLTGNVMVAYYFPGDWSVTPYAGGQLTAAYYDFDEDGGGDDTETEIGPGAVGGIEMQLEGGNRFLAEVQFGFSDLPEVKVLAGWTF